MSLKLGDQQGGRGDEITAVPEVAGGEVGLGGLQVRFLDEGRDGPGVLPPGRTDIAIGRGGCVRPHPQGDDPARLGMIGGADHGGPERRGVGDVVVGRDHGQDALRVAGQHPQRRRRHSRRRVPGRRLQQHLGRDPNLVQLPGDQCGVGEPAHHQGRGRAVEAGDPDHGVLEAGARAQQVGELLGPVGAGGRPEAHPRTATHDHRIDRHARLLPLAAPPPRPFG